jgi:KaiC/GvpD/RAD55 family RecA-like ATPase
MAVSKQLEDLEDKPKAFSVFGLDEIPDPGQTDIVQRLYGHGSVIAMVGPPNAGKTALGVDHGLSIAARETWFGLKVSGGPVIYFAPEAPGSVIMRAKAAAGRKYAERRLPFYIATGTPELGGEITSVIDAERIIATIRQVESSEGEAVKLAQIDTLASCLGNGDENGDGMIRLVAAAKHVATATGTSVMLIHHPSKADNNGLRGHGSLAAACDCIITIAVDEVSGTRTATLVKSRDSATGLQFCYTLEQVTLPEPDSFGDARTTIVVTGAAVQQRRPKPTGARQQAMLAELERRYRTGEHGWSEAVMREAGRGIGIKPQSVRDAVRGLCGAGYIWGQPDNFTLKYPPDESTK